MGIRFVFGMTCSKLTGDILKTVESKLMRWLSRVLADKPDT